MSSSSFLPSCCCCWPSPAPSASSPQRAASRASPSPHASPCEGCANLPRHSHKKYFFARAQFFVSLARKHRTGTRALPPLPPTSPLAHKASSPEVRPPHSSYSSFSSSSAPPPVARRPESLSWKRPLLTAHSHVSTTTTPPSMTCHTLLPTPHKSSLPYICQNCQMHNCQNLQFYLAKWQHSIHMSPVPILSMTGQWSGHSLAPFHLQFNLNFP